MDKNYLDKGQVRFIEELIVEKNGKCLMRFAETEGGLIVKQGAKEYLARKWKLTPQFKETVKMILESGLTCLMRQGSPSPKHLNVEKGVEYVGFSRGPSERWVMVLDQFSGGPERTGRSSVQQLTVEKHYKDVLDKACIPNKLLESGGRNYFVERRYLPDLLKAITDEAINVVEESLHRESKTKSNLEFMSRDSA